MDWEIVSFEHMGVVKFGMTPLQVAQILGSPRRTRKGLQPSSFAEFRTETDPVIRYRDGVVTEIEAFYEVPNVKFKGVNIFEGTGTSVLRELESLNGGALISVGIILFNKIGITTGRIDEEPRTGHSITAFATGLWNNKINKFTEISFL